MWSEGIWELGVGGLEFMYVKNIPSLPNLPFFTTSTFLLPLITTNILYPLFGVLSCPSS